MRSYVQDEVCGFRFTRAEWGPFSNFWPLPAPIAAGPWRFATSEHLYQAAKFASHPSIQQRIANARTARACKAIGRSPGLEPGWNARRADVMRWILRLKREANRETLDALLADTVDRPIVEVSLHDHWWGASPAGTLYRGHNVLGRLWMELRQQLREHDPTADSAAWAARVRVGSLSGTLLVPKTHPRNV